MDESTERLIDTQDVERQVFDTPRPGCLRRTLRGMRNGFFSGSFSLQNTALYTNELITTAKKLGSMQDGKETQSLAFPFIMLGSGNLFIANNITYYTLVDNYLNQDGRCDCERNACCSPGVAINYFLGFYTTLLKLAGGLVSTFSLSETLIGKEKGFGGPLAITLLTAPGNFLSNIAFYSAPDVKREYTFLENIMIVKFLEKTGLSGREKMQIYDRVHNPLEDGELSGLLVGLAHAIAFSYSSQNAVLYYNSFYNRAVANGAIVKATATSNPLFYFLIGGVAVPIFAGNYVSYLRLMKEFIRSRMSVREGFNCSGFARRFFGSSCGEVTKNLNGLGGVAMKYAGTVMSSVDLLTEWDQPLWLALFLSFTVSIGNGGANIGLFLSKKVDADKSPFSEITSEDLELLAQSNNDFSSGTTSEASYQRV